MKRDSCWPEEIADLEPFRGLPLFAGRRTSATSFRASPDAVRP